MRSGRRVTGVAVVLATCVAASACVGERDTAASRKATDTTAAVDPCAGSGALSAGGVGAVKIGARVRDVAALCRMADTSLSLGEGMKERGHLFSVGRARILAFSTGTRDTSITRVTVRDSSYRTDRGIGIGSTVGDLRRAYGHVCATFGEGRVVVSADAIPGLSFETTLTALDVPGGVRTLEQDAGLVPDNAVLTTAWATDGPSLCGGS